MIIVKKILIFCLCLFITGCGPNKKHQIANEEPQIIVEDNIGWVGEYVNDDLTLIIVYEADYPEGFRFDFSLGQKGFANYAYFEDGKQKKAIYDANELGYTLTFELKNDKVIVRESGGTSYLDTDLSRTYQRK